jgi:YYY domain-containing protein
MFQELLKHWLVIQALGVLALPLSGLLLRALPDKGYAFSKSLGLLVVGYGAWLLAMLGLAPFNGPMLVIMALLMAGAGWWLWRGRGAGPILPQVLPSRMTILGYELLFLAVMLGAAWLRAHEPVPWGTERPMDFAFFNAIQRSPSFPPADPWLAGYSINYYYFGYLLMAAVNLLAGQEPAVGYNLSLALLAGLTAIGVAGAVVNAIKLTKDEGRRTKDEAGMSSFVFRPSSLLEPFFALLAVVFVLLASNQAGALQVLVGNEQVVALDGGQTISAVQQALSGASEIQLPAPVATDSFGVLQTLPRADKWNDFNWWWPSRVLWDEYPTGGPQGEPQRRYTITEFPFFSFRLGDMHPHVMALPFGLLAIALAMATVARPAAPMYGSGKLGWAELLLSGLILGSLYAINSWDLPTYGLLFAAALWLLFARLAGAGKLEWRFFATQLGMVVAAALALFLPFFLTFRSLVGSAEPLINLPLIGGLSRTIGVYTAERSGLIAFLVIFGLFVVPLVGFVYAVSGRSGPVGTQPAASVPFGIVAGRSPFSVLSSPFSLVRWLPVILLLLGLIAGFPLLALAALGLFAFWSAFRLRENSGQSFALLIVALGCAICFGTEIVYIRDVFEGNSQRFNTIFKFYYQVWLLWGTFAAYGLWWLCTRTSKWQRIVSYGVAGLSTVFLLGALVYPYLSLRDINKGEVRDLNAPTPREQSPAGAASIRWLRENAIPGSVVLEAVDVLNMEDVVAQRADPFCGGSYDVRFVGYAGISAATGFPTVLGWAGHEGQWRGGDKIARDELGPRCVDVYRIYNTLDVNEAQELLQRYNVRYVYVGGLERSAYSGEGLAKFDGLGQRVFEQDEVVIYEVGG